MTSLIDLVAENRTQAAVLATLMAVFTAAATYLFDHYSSSQEREARFRELTTKIEEQQAEFSRSSGIFNEYEALVAEYGKWTEQLDASLTSEALTPPNVGSTRMRVIEASIDMQARVAATRARVGAEYFESVPLKDVQARLVLNLEQLETFLATRVEFLRVMGSDPTAARKQAEVLRHNLDGRRFGAEGDARTQVVVAIFERARRVHNDEVATANASLASYRTRGKLAVASSAYIGAFAGGFLGWRFSRWRKRRRVSALAHAPDHSADD